MENSEDSNLLYGLNEQPRLLPSSIAALGHLAAVVASILAAPFLMCEAIGLNAEDTRYVLSASLVVSGIATFIQVYRFGNLGCGMVAVQGTSFAFVGPLAYLAPLYVNEIGATMFVGKILGTCAVCGIVMMIGSFFLEKLQTIITPTVAGTTIFILGLSLVESAVKNLSYVASDGSTLTLLALAAQGLITVGVILMLMRLKTSLIRVASIPIGLFAGCLFAYISGNLIMDTDKLVQPIFVLAPIYFPLDFDLLLLFLLLPIFAVSLTESIGDITATSAVSSEPISGPVYLRRLRGGILADGFNTSLAAIFGTFPNTTFSQNNAVIRITGIASRKVGLLLASMLVIFGTMPQVSYLFTIIPSGVINSATGLMFSLITYTGYKIALNNGHDKSFKVLAISCFSAFVLRECIVLIPFLHENLPAYLIILLGFPVATGAILAVLIDGKLRLG